MANEDTASRLAVIESLLSRMEGATLKSFEELSRGQQEMNENFNRHLIDTANFNSRLQSVEITASKHDEQLNGKDGVISQLQSLQEIVGSAKKVGWELMKPFLYVIGVGIVVVAGALGLFIWQLSQLISTIQHIPVP